MESKSYITLSELTKQIEKSIKESDLALKWITFEIKAININPKGHCYIEMIEKSDKGDTIASSRATIWSSIYRRILSNFEYKTGGTLKIGMKVLALASVIFHPVYGLSINITDIDPTFTIGESERIKRETIKQLQEDGIWDMNHDIPIPDIIQRIAVISSSSAAGYGDFCHQIEESGLNISTTLFQSAMQGQDAEESIIQSLNIIASQYENFDAIVIIRGGGAVGDLDCFDGYDLCSTIAQMPLPVITGIGHDRDTSVADMVAAIPLKTPTAVAAWLVGRIQNFLEKFERITREIKVRSQQLIMWMWNQIDNNDKFLHNRALDILSRQELELTRSRASLSSVISNLVHKEKDNIIRLKNSIHIGSMTYITNKQKQIDSRNQFICLYWTSKKGELLSKIEINNQKLRSISETVIEKNKQRIESNNEKLCNTALYILDKENTRIKQTGRLLNAHNPKNIIRRGYAIVSKENSIISSTDTLHSGDIINIQMRDAIIESEVKKIKNK